MRVATFNIENLDRPEPGSKGPTLAARFDILRPQLERLRVDVLLLQEVHGQDQSDGPRSLEVLDELLAGTRYAGHQKRSTMLANGRDVEAVRNLVTLVPPEWVIEESREILHEYTPCPVYDRVTETEDRGAKDVRWDRPLLYTRVAAPFGQVHLINCHFKSKIPTPIGGQKINNYTWRSTAGWAEGFFLSSMKRVGAALETRVFLDTLFDADPDPLIVLGGDMNAESHEVPVMALRGEVGDHGNPALNNRVMYPCEESVPIDARFTLYHHGKPNMLDHLLVSRGMIGAYLGTEIHNEIVRDESIAFATDLKYPSSDHAPVVAGFDPEMLARV